MAEGCSTQDFELVPTIGDLSSLEGNCEMVTAQNNDQPPGAVGTRQDLKEASVMVAGKPRSGKSKALNNIFDLKLEAEPSAASVTKYINRLDVERNGAILHVIDTPGLGALDVKKKEVLKDMSTLKIKGDFTFLYCLPVAPSSALTDTDRIIIKNLNSIFGKKIWEKCFLLLTFSDTARRDEFSSLDQVEEYKKYLKGHCEAFQQALKECGVKAHEVKTIFEYKSKEQRENETLKGIVALPVGKCKDGETDILPGIQCGDTRDWTDYAFIEIIKKAGKLSLAFIRLKYNIAIVLGSTGGIGIAGALAGTAVGAGIGFGAGAVGGPIGMAAGAAVGAVSGAVLTLAGGIPISMLVTSVKSKLS